MSSIGSPYEICFLLAYRKHISLWRALPGNCITTEDSNLCHEPSSIEVESRTRHELSIHNEITDGTGYLLTGACPTERYFLHYCLLCLLWNHLPHIGGYGAGTKSVYCHVVASQFQRCCLAEAGNASFSS